MTGSSAVLDPSVVSLLAGQLRLLRFGVIRPLIWGTFTRIAHFAVFPGGGLYFDERGLGCFSLLKDGIQALIQWVDDFKH